jgi:hypothetical protein
VVKSADLVRRTWCKIVGTWWPPLPDGQHPWLDWIGWLLRRKSVTSIQNQCNLGTHASHARKARRMAAEAHLATLLYSSKQAIRCTPKFTNLQKKLGIYTPTRGRERKPKRQNVPFVHFSSYLQEGFWLSIKQVLGCLLHKTKNEIRASNTTQHAQLLQNHSQSNALHSPTAAMGLCASMLQRKAKIRHPEPRRGMPKALFVVRNDRRQSNKPQALVVQQVAQNPAGSSRFQKPGKAQAPSTSRKNDKCSYGCTDVLDMGRRLCLPINKPARLPCGNTTSVVAVEPVAAPGGREPVFKGAATTERSAVEGCRTPMTPRRTPVWQRRILMGTRCELPRFSGVILYDEHGRRLQSGTKQNRAADHHVSRARRAESKVMRSGYTAPSGF